MKIAVSKFFKKFIINYKYHLKLMCVSILDINILGDENTFQLSDENTLENTNSTINNEDEGETEFFFSNFFFFY